MKIHFHTDNHAFSGSEVVLMSLLRWAAASPGVEATLTYRTSPGYASSIEAHLPSGLTVVPLRLPDPTDLGERFRGARPIWYLVRGGLEISAMLKLLLLYDVVRLRRCFRRSRPDVVHVNNGGFPGAISCNAAALAARLAGVPAVTYVVNNLAIPRRGVRRSMDWPVDRLVARAVDRFVTGSAAAATRLREVLALAPAQVTVIPNGVADTVSVAPSGSALPPTPPGAVVVLVAARLEQRKGHRVLFEAVGQLRRAGAPTPMLLLAGDGPERVRLEYEVERLGISRLVHFLGHRQDVRQLLQMADLLVLPSIDQEDFPLVILEAMAAGRPVIATTVAGVPEQVVDGQTGTLVPPGDAEALRAALSDLMLDSHRRASYGAAGRRRFLQRFTAEIAVERYEGLYTELVTRATT